MPFRLTLMTRSQSSSLVSSIPRGAELMPALLNPIDHLRLDWSGGYNKFKSGVKTPGAPGYLTPGNHRQPEWNMHADASYEIGTPLGSFTPRIDWTWQSQQDFDPASNIRAPLPIYIIKPYSLWNAQLMYKPNDSLCTSPTTAGFPPRLRSAISPTVIIIMA
jgi:hypothetical protein